MQPPGGPTAHTTKRAWADWSQRPDASSDTLAYDAPSTSAPAATSQRGSGRPQHVAATGRPDLRPASPKRPLGNPPVTELDPRTPSQNIRLKHRASTLIQKYAGHRWREAQRTKWLIDIVCHIDRDYRQYIDEQAAEIEVLHEQLQRTTSLQMTSTQAIKSQNEQLRQRVDWLEKQLQSSQGALLDMQNRMAASEVALNEAEEAARGAAEECMQLQQAVTLLAAHDAASRKQLANRAHVLKDALVASRSRVRQAAEHSRRHNVEVKALLSLQAKEAEEHQAALVQQMKASVAAANTLQRTAARLEIEQLQLELTAFKEPWQYMFRDKSPTKDPELTKRLRGNLKMKSMNMPIPF